MKYLNKTRIDNTLEATEKFMDNFILLVEEELKNRELNKIKLAEKLDYPSWYIYQVLNKEQIPSLNILIAISLMLDIKMSVEKK